MGMPEFPAHQEAFDGANAQMVNAAEVTIEGHNDRAGFVIDDRQHGVVMLLVDVIAYCDAHAIDLDRELQSARETFDHVKE